MKKQFTLIELIVVITIISILAAIVVPNIASMKGKALQTAVTSNKRSLQTVSDMYQLDNNGSIPIIGEVNELLPQPIDFAKVYPNHLRNLPKTEGVKYWLDVTGGVWASYTDMLSNLDNSDPTNVTWDKMDDASGYQVFEVQKTKNTSSTQNANIRYKEVYTTSSNEEVQYSGTAGKTYVVSSIDTYGNFSAPIGVKSYTGYVDTLESIKKGHSSSNPEAPIANITVSPSTTVRVNEPITWDYSNSYDPQGDSIVDVEWKGKQDSYPTPGDYSVSVRVQDDKGNWSDWKEIIIKVIADNSTLKPVITYTPNSNITPQTDIYFSGVNSNDTTGKAITAYEWKLDNNATQTTAPNGKLSEGSHTVKLRVQNEEGVWSEWTTTTITVSNVQNPITAVITMTPNTNITVETSITWSYANSTDSTGKTITAAEWTVDGKVVTSPPTKFAEGDHTIILKVKNSDGVWSEPVTKTITVAQVAPKNPYISNATSTYNSVILYFTAQNATTIEIYRNGVTAPVGTVAGTATSFQNTGLAEMTNYSYTIKAINSAGSVTSSSYSIQTKQNIPVPTGAYLSEYKMTNKTASGATKTDLSPVLTLQFKATGATYASIYRNGLNVSNIYTITNGTIDYEDYNATWNQTNTYYVEFGNNGGITRTDSTSISMPSASFDGQGKIKPSTAAPTLNISGTSPSAGQINVTISSTGASMVSSFGKEFTGNASGTYSVTGLQSNTLYYVQAFAMNADFSGRIYKAVPVTTK